MADKSIQRVRAYLSSLDRFPHNFSVTVGISVVAAALGMFYPYLFARIVDHYQARNVSGFMTYMAALLALQLAQMTLTLWANLVRRRYDLFANVPIILRFYEKVQSLPMVLFRKFMHTG